ncbi:MAG: oligosaccharide flippase family protein [Candidatus Magasanikbacteria bacterium]|nr:oligosaccharide flippase family protein [Candidatus Magasanikbacteria bacterium]
MSTTRKIAHNTIVQIGGKVISTFLGLIALSMLTRYLEPTKFGWYITTIAFLQFIAILIDFGLVPVTAQMMSEPRFDKEKLLKNLLGFRFVSATIFFAIAPLIALFFPYPTPVKIAIAFTSLSFFANAMNQIFIGFYQQRLKMYIQAIGEVIGRIILVVGLFILINLNGSFLWVMGVITISGVSYMVVMWLAAIKYTRPSFAFNKKIWQEIVKKMWPIAISIIFNVVYLKGDILLLSIFRDQTEVGFYGAPYRVIDILAQTAMMLMGVIMPLLAFSWSRNQADEFKTRFQQAFDAMMLLAVPMTVGTIVLAPKIMNLVAGDKYMASAKPLQILSLAVFGVFVGAIFGHTAVAINKQKQTIWVYASNAIITLIGYLIFIPLYGMYGAAWMTVFSELYAALFLYVTVRRYIKQKIQLKTLAKIILSSLCMAFAICQLINLNVILLTVIGMVVYGAVMFVIGGISKKTLMEIISMKSKNK